MKEFFFILLIAMVTAMPVSIGSCQKYSPDGQKCQACIPNYHLFQGSCYVDILGCRQYQFGNICHQCQKNYILVNNMCCDMVCMSKIFSKFKKEVKEEVIASNTEILSQLIPFIQGQYLNGTTSRLIAIEVNQYLEAKRFFLLYEFYETQIYTKRLVIDYVFKSKKYVILDWSIVRNSWKFSTVEWQQVQDDASILLHFPKLYPSGQSYTQVVARKAVLGLIDQFELLTLVDDKMLVRILYDNKGEVVLLRETETIQPKPEIIVVDQHPVVSNNDTTSTQTSSNTTTTNTDSTTSTNTTTSTTSTNTTTSVFTAYEYKYIGNDILAQYSSNQGLKLSYNLVHSDQYWNHTVTMIIETGKVPAVIQFIIIGENKLTGSVIKYSIKYNVPTKETFIVSISEQFVTVQQQIVVVNTTVTQTHTQVVVNGSITSTNTSAPTHTETTTTTPIISMTESKVFIVEQGCTTHTYYIYPFAHQIQTIANDLKIIRQQYYSAHPNTHSPLINLNSLLIRRIVVTQSCVGSNYREVAFIQSDSTTSTWEYFTYYLQIQSPIKSRFYLGTNNKTQSVSVYNSPYAYPIYVSDPSYLLYPTASTFYQTGVNSLYLSNLTLPDTSLFRSLTVIPTSQKDRHMGKIIRFSIDGINHFNNDKFRMIGYRMIEEVSGLSTTGMLSLICPNGKNSESLVIGSNGLITDITSTITNITNNSSTTVINTPSLNTTTNSTTNIHSTTIQQIKTLLPTTQQLVTTSILTSFLGDPTVQTTNIISMIRQDTILQQILNKLLIEKPIIRDYYLSNLLITEYNQALEYHLEFKQSNLNQLINFIPTSWVLAAVVHDKTRSQNILISFQVKSLSNINVNIGNFDPSNIFAGINFTIPTYNNGYVVNDPNLINIGIGNITDPYVVVDVNAPTFNTNITIPSINTTLGNITIPVIQPINPTIPVIPTIPTDPSITLPDDDNTTPIIPIIPPTIQQTLTKISTQQRVKQILQIILLQLKLSYGISSPNIVQLLQQINELEHLVKLTMIVEDVGSKSNYSVIAIGQLLTLSDPLIESVKPITQEVVDKIVQVATPVVVNNTINVGNNTINVGNTTTNTTTTETTPTTPTDTTHNNTQIPPDSSTTHTNTTTPSDSTTSHTTNTTSTQTTNTTQTNTNNTTTTPIIQPSIPISTPSQTVIHLVQQKSYQQTTQSADGQIRKIYINPTQSTLTPQIQQALNLVKQQQHRLQQTQGITLSPKITVKSIQLSATTIYVHYAITIRIVFTQTVIIRRYYVIYTLNASTTTQPVHMGHQDLPVDFDPSLKQNRAYKDLVLLQNTQANSQSYQNVLTVVNNNYNLKYTIINIIYYYYRVFPLGRYVKVTIKDQLVVGNLHLILMNSNSYYLMKWHTEVIQQLVHNVSNNNTVVVVSNGTSTNTTTGQQQVIVNNQTTSTQTPVTDTTHTNTTGTTTDHSSNTTTIVVTQNTTHPATDTTTNTTTTTSTTNTTTTTNTPTPQQLINKQQTITNTSTVIISLSMQQKLSQVLKYLSVQKGTQLQGGSLQQYAATQDKSSDGSVNAVQFDFYFLKFIHQHLLREFICSVIRHQVDGRIDIALFISNDIDLGETQTQTQTNSNNTNTNTSTTTTTTTNDTTQSSTSTNTTTTITTNVTDSTSNTTTVQTVVKQQQINMNSNITIVDPNQLYYPQAIHLIQQDPLKQQFQQTLDFNNLPSYIDDIIKYIRAKYTIIINAHGLRIVRSTKTTTIQRFRIYLFKQTVNTNGYQIYRTIIDYNTSTTQTQYNIISFQLYAHNRTLAIQLKINDLSIQDDTDIAYGYVNLQLQSISTNENVQNVLKYLNNKYHTVIKNKTIAKIQELKLFDGRINYKILYRDTVELSQFKFIIFYQPLLQKVLVLNSVNLPHHSQYNQLTSQQQKSDSVFNAVLSYVNSIHPELSGFTLRSVSKATQSTFSQYQLYIQFQNRKYKSLVRIASNNVDMTEIDFSQQVEISLDHYKLDQFDEMFIMNYQKISQDQIKSNSKLRMILSYLYNSHQVPSQAQFLGAAFKPFGLGFLYKAFFKIGVLQQLTSAQVYIQAYSDKITLKNIKKISFDENLLSITAEQNIMTKIITLIKQKSNFTEFTVQTVSAKDFLYGTLYKFTISAQSEIFEIVVYHDHSTEEIILLFVRQNQSQDQCVYQGTNCGSCKSANFRVQNNKCVQNIVHCTKYQSDSEYCAVCDQNSDLVNGICILKANCGALCQIASI